MILNFFFEVQSHFFQYQATHDQRKMNCFMVKSSHSIFVICTIRGAKLFLLKTHPCINETSDRMRRTSVVQLSFWASWSYNQLLKYLRHCTVFGINGLSMILCLWSPSTPYQRCWQYHDSKLEGTTLNGGGGGGGSIISHRPVTSSDWSKKGWFFCRSASTFLQLVVHVACTSQTVILTCPLNFFDFNSMIDQSSSVIII